MSANNSPQPILKIRAPKSASVTTDSAQTFFTALHKLLTNAAAEQKTITTHDGEISLEITADKNGVSFYAWTAPELQPGLQTLFFQIYPQAQVEIVDDYASRIDNDKPVCSTDLQLSEDFVLPIRPLTSFDQDPIGNLSHILAEVTGKDSTVYLQFILRAIPDDWHKKSTVKIEKIKSGRSARGTGVALQYGLQLFGALVKPPETTRSDAHQKPLSDEEQSLIESIEQKAQKPGYEAHIRLILQAETVDTLKQQTATLLKHFGSYAEPAKNSFKARPLSFSTKNIGDYQDRFFNGAGNVLNTAELAGLYHLPYGDNALRIQRTTTKQTEPPTNLPTTITHNESELSGFGVTSFQGQQTTFGLLREDRTHHVYVIGQTGTGKSCALELLTLSDMYWDQGVAVIDPHGDYAQHILRYIPERRIDDVVYFNPADTDFPIAFNPLEVPNIAARGQTASQLIEVFKKTLLQKQWSDDVEYLLRYSILALLERDGSTLLDINRLYTDARFRKKIASEVTDIAIRNFWGKEFDGQDSADIQKTARQIAGRLSLFTADPAIRNIIGQPHSSFNIRSIMDQGKILIVNVSRGMIGEENSSILGALIIAKIQQSAMGRAELPQQQRKTFYVYVDEFQNFAANNVQSILNEARKYGLSLTLSNQHLDQVDSGVKGAVADNVGTVICFRVSDADASHLATMYTPQLSQEDLTTQDNRNFAIAMTIGGRKAQAFSARTLSLPSARAEQVAHIIQLSRERYGRPRAIVEQLIGTVTPARLPALKQATPHGVVHVPRSIVKKVVSQKIKPVKPTLPISIVHKLTTTALDAADTASVEPKGTPSSVPPLKSKKRRSRRKPVKGRAEQMVRYPIGGNKNNTTKKSTSIERLNKDEVIRLR